MRALFREWLEAEGYRVLSRGDEFAGGEAPGPDLVILDLVNLPMQGAQAVQQVKRLYPRAVLIGTSTQLCRSLPADSARARALSVSALVSKPCRRDELLAAVVGAIGAAR